MNAAIVIPICCVCNKVRENVRAEGDRGQWDTLGVFLRAHHLSSGEYRLTHTYCPACATQFSKLAEADGHSARRKTAKMKPDYASPVAATILEVFSGIQKCDLDMLVRACPTLTWNQVFSEVDRLSRIGKLRLSYLGQGQYSIELPEAYEMPLVAQPSACIRTFSSRPRSISALMGK